MIIRWGLHARFVSKKNGGLFPTSPLFENNEDRPDHHGKAGKIIPFQFFLQIDNRKDAKYDQGNHFLDRFQCAALNW